MGLFSTLSRYVTKCSPNIPEETMISRVRNRRVHMANERTFLSWIRTSIGIMAFGFVVEKFGIFIKQVSYYITKEAHPGIPVGHTPGTGYSSVLGILLIGLGALMGVLAFIRYRKVECQIETDSYRPSLILDILLALSLFAIGIFLIIYIVHSI